MARNTNLENAMKELRKEHNQKALNKFKEINSVANLLLLNGMNAIFVKIGLPELSSIDVGGYDRSEYLPNNDSNIATETVNRMRVD